MTPNAQATSTTTKVVVASWMALCATGMWQLSEHAATPGEPGPVMTRMPQNLASTLQWSFEQDLLVLAAHPQCPSLTTSLNELDIVLADRPTTAIRILLFEPSEKPPQWDPAARDLLIQGLPEGTVMLDQDGKLATRLGATTSGHISLFQANGKLSFAGGVTGSRGRHGNEQSRRSLQQAMRTPASEPTRTHVYGCPLQAPCNCPQ